MNSIHFSKEQFENGEMDTFIHELNKLSYGQSDDYFQILIKPEDCGAYSVEFVQLPWSGDYGGTFDYINEDQYIMYRRDFPDNHYEYFESEYEYQEALKEWLAENPGWEKNNFGHWIYNNSSENIV